MQTAMRAGPETTSESPAAQRNRLVLPLASFLNDLGWELPVMLLPLFVLNVLHAGPIAVGVIEGVADATGTIAKLFSGLISDRFGNRKRLTASGYLLANIARPALFVVTAWPAAVGVRFAERVGKGLRTSARDALLADSLPAGQTGSGFGFLRAMDSFGAFGSLLLGMGVIWLSQGNALRLTGGTFRTLVAIAAVPGLLAVVTIVLFARELPVRRRSAIDFVAHAGLSREFIVFTSISVLFMLGNSSDAFVIVRAQGLGGTTLVVVALMTGFNLLYGLTSRPFGKLSDTFGKSRLIIIGWLVYAAVYVGFARAGSLVHVGLLLVPYALYYAMTEGVGRALVADLVPQGSRGAAYGVYHGAVGASALLASIIAGVLYEKVGPSAPFVLGAALAAVASVLLAVFLPRRELPLAEAA